MKHEINSPSSFAKREHCPGSLEAERQAPPLPPSEYSVEGDTFHLLLHRMLTGYDLWGHEGKELDISGPDEPPCVIPVTREMCEHAQTLQEYLDNSIQEIEMLYGGPVMVRSEVQVDPSPLLETANTAGTLDVALVSDNAVEVIEAKYGAGIPVDVDGDDFLGGLNGQLMQYLVGLVAEYDGKSDWAMKITVFQPRRPHPDGPIRSKEITHRDLVDWIGHARQVYREAAKPNAPRTPHPKACQWCAAQVTCQARKAHFEEATGLPALENVEAVQVAASAPLGLTLEQACNVVENLPFLRSYLKAVEDYVFTLRDSPTPPDEVARRFKIVQGKGNRRWREGFDETLKALQAIRWTDPITGKSTGMKKPTLMEHRLRSPTQITKEFERLHKQGLVSDTSMEAVQRLIERPLGSRTLAPADDSRESITKTVDEMFPVEEEM